MKKPLFIILLLFCFSEIKAQMVFGSWEKINKKKLTNKAEDNSNTPKVEGLKDLGSDTYPSPRSGAMTWKDNDGNFWLFGGTGTDMKKKVGAFNDLWKFDTKARIWQLVKGERFTEKQTPQTQKNIEKATNTPSGRRDAANWLDKDGNFWLYGGRSMDDFTIYDDMWMFDVKKGNWILTSDNKRINAANKTDKKGEAKNTNAPGSRSGSATWTDGNGNLWLFGGLVLEKSKKTSGYYNDLWKYDTKTKIWVWVAGGKNPNSKQIKEVKKNGVESTEDTPSGRYAAIGWVDKSGEKLWLYGGYGIDNKVQTTGGLSDMWFFNIKKNVWRWHSGPLTFYEKANQEISGLESPKATPGFRYGAVGWTDKSGDLWLFGGQSKFSKDTVVINNDLWKFNPKTERWTSVLANGGPPIIHSAQGFVDDKDAFWLFGGVFINNHLNYQVSNDLWKFTLNKQL